MQAQGLVILNHLDFIESAVRDRDALKRSLVANGGFDHEALFPDFFPPKKKQESAGGDLDYSEIVWKSPTDSVDEWKRMQEVLAGTSRGQINGEQMTPTWTEWR